MSSEHNIHAVNPLPPVVVALFLILMGIFKVGAVAVPLNYMLRQREIKYILEDCGARTFILDPEIYRQNVLDRAAFPGVRNWVMAGPEREVPEGEGFLSLDRLLAGVPDSFQPVEIDPEDPVARGRGVQPGPAGSAETGGPLPARRQE